MRLRKLLTSLLLSLVLIVNQGLAAPALVLAIDYPTPPTEATVDTNIESTAQEPSEPTAPTEPTKPSNYQEPVQDETTTDPATQDQTPDATTTNDQTDTSTGNTINTDPQPTQENNTQQDPAVTPESTTQQSDVQPLNTSSNDTGSDNQDKQVGDTTINTGDSLASGAISNDGNTNIASADAGVSGTDGTGGSDITIQNDGNGAASDNNAAVSDSSTDSTIQDNTANIDNGLGVSSNSGDNSASRNVGNSSIQTGDAAATGTITNAVNTNIDGAVVSEFNVVDDQTGDIVLDTASHCVSGCDGTGDIVAQNTDNGVDSTNSADVGVVNDTSTFQNNDANVNNELVIAANTGNNETDRNTGGDNSIQTGDATVVGSVLNFLNNNIAGNVYYTTVNIYGQLTGDIVLPEDAGGSSSGDPSVALMNTNNGSGSDNSAAANTTTSDTYSQFNNADIVNNLIVDANTGGNETSKNTNGDNSIQTGDSNVNASILNVANTNVVGGDWWIVLVNDAGNWLGRILAPDGSFVGGYFAVAPGSVAQTADNGAVNVTNSGNGANSQNSGSVEQTTTNTTVQNNNAVITNDIHLSANTGDNSASRNTGGSNTIKTGDANVQFNLVNFVNNNFAGGNVFLTVVNVFGNWLGDFVAPGAAKAQDPDQNDNGIGGTGDTPNQSTNQDNNNNNSSSDNSSSDNSSSSSSSSEESSPQVLAASTLQSTTGSYGGGSSSGEEDSHEDLALANTGLGSSDEDSGFHINLAWALAIIPLYFVFRLVRRRFIGA